MSRDMAYIALCSCGGIVMAGVDTPTNINNLTKSITSCLKEGYKIKRIGCDKVKTQTWCNNKGKCAKTKHPWFGFKYSQ